MSATGTGETQPDNTQPDSTQPDSTQPGNSSGGNTLREANQAATDQSGTDQSSANHAIETQPIGPQLQWKQFSLRMALRGYVLEPVAGQRLHLRNFLLQITWPQGGYVWQTPVDLRWGEAPTAQRIWLFNRTRLALLVIGAVAALLIRRAKS